MKTSAFALTVALVVSSVGALAACSSSTDATPVAPADAGIDAATGGDPVKGAALASSLGCHGCHDSTAGVMAGSTSVGTMQKLNGATLTVFAANLTPDDDTGLGHATTGGWDDTQLARAIRTGVDDGCAQLCSVMPLFPMGDDEMTSLIAYLRSLTPVKNSVDMQGCPTLDPTNGGGGATFPDAGDCASDDPDAGP